MTVPSPRADTYDVMGEGSFPASDPPAVWTWEVEKLEPAETGDPDRSSARGGANVRESPL